MNFLEFHYEDENGEIVTWKVNPTHIVDACIHEDGEVYICTTGTNGEGILIIETAEEFEKATAPLWLSCSIDETTYSDLTECSFKKVTDDCSDIEDGNTEFDI